MSKLVGSEIIERRRNFTKGRLDYFNTVTAAEIGITPDQLEQMRAMWAKWLAEDEAALAATRHND